MRYFQPRSGPFKKGFYYEPEELDAVCIDALEKTGSLPQIPQPIDIERFLEKRFGQIVSYEDLPNDCLGCTVFDRTGKVKAIAVHRNLADGSKMGDLRVRSTWAHEAGHALLHSPLFNQENDSLALIPDLDPGVQADRILCRSEDISPSAGRSQYGGRWWEWQANRCIGGLLLPKPLVITLIRPLLEETRVTKSLGLPQERRIKAEGLVSETFEVSSTVSRIRLEEMFPPSADKQMSF